jgi:hypothetical protein
VLRLFACDVREALDPKQYPDFEVPGFWAEFLAISVLMVFTAGSIKLSEQLQIPAATAVGHALAPLIMVPATRIFGGVFVGCTFYDQKPNTMDADPTLSCWTSWVWWVYAVPSVFGLAGLGLCVVQNAKNDGNLSEKPSHPQSVKYAQVFSFVKVFTTLVHTAFGRWHPRLTSSVYIATDACLIFVILYYQPFVHNCVTRLSIYGNVQTMIGFISALVALAADNPSSTASELVFIWMSLVAMAAYIGCELFLFLSPGDLQFMFAKEFGDVYELDDEGKPLGKRHVDDAVKMDNPLEKRRSDDDDNVDDNVDDDDDDDDDGLSEE